MELHPITIEQAQKADLENICRQAGANLFHRPAWLTLLSRLSDEGQLHLLGIFNKEDLSGLLPLWLDRKLGFLAPNRAPVTPYLSPVIRLPHHPAKSASRMEQLVNLIAPRLKRYPLGRLFLPPEMIDIRPFLAQGFSALPRYTNRIIFEKEGEPDFLPQVRNKLRRAEKAGLVVEESGDVEALIKLNQDTYRRQGIPSIFSENFLRSVMELLVAAGHGKLWLCRNPEGEPIACRLVLRDENWGYDLLAASADRREGEEDFGAGPFLVAHILSEMRTLVAGYDFCGANIPTISAFKASFGGKLSPFFCISWGKTWARALSPILRRFS